MPRRWSYLLSITAIFLVLFFLLHKSTDTPRAASRLTNGPSNGFVRQQILCPSTPPNPPYNRSSTDGFNWGEIPVRYPVSDFIPLSTNTPATLPRIQYSSFPPQSPITKSRQAAIKAAFQRAWTSYTTHAWKADELRPITAGSRNNFGGWGATLVDNLDTLLIMGLDEEFAAAVDALADIDFSPHISSSSPQSTINIFETTIRHLGGLLAAYDLTGCRETRLLDKAIQLGEMIYTSFDTENRIPVPRWNLHKAGNGEPQRAAAQGVLAELASSSLEFTRLSQLTGDMRYFDAASRITDLLDSQAGHTRIPGLWPVSVNLQKGDLTRGSTFSFGGMADSAYEYLGKTYRLLGGVGKGPQYERLARNALDAGTRHLLFRPMTPDHADILLSGVAHATSSSVGLEPRTEHLACFVGGMYALAGRLFSNETYLDTGRKLTDGCIWYYDNSPLGIMPEMLTVPACPSVAECPWDETRGGIYTYVRDGHYVLRPEAMESIFYMWRITGDEKYREAAWRMFTAIEAVTKTEFGNAAVRDVMVEDGNVEREDSMESFWMAETLKYLYLIFGEADLLSLDDWVFNTEAHPLRGAGR
ncbi:glycoside hydrolase [Aspergillus nidulans var. acristatus]